MHHTSGPARQGTFVLRSLPACAQVCYYRDKQTTNKFQIAKVTKDGASVSEPFAIQTKWDYRVTPLSHPAL